MENRQGAERRPVHSSKRRKRFDSRSGFSGEAFCCSIIRDCRKTVFEESVLQTQRVHLFPFRTQKLSSAVAKILYGRLYGKIAQCRHRMKGRREEFLLPGIRGDPRKPGTSNGGVAQLGEHLPCKQGVMGSNPIISTRTPETESGKHKCERRSTQTTKAHSSAG